MKLTLNAAKRMMDARGNLDLRGRSDITSLPEGLTVGGWLDLEGCTGITRLPEGLTVGGWLDLEGCTGITSLPEGLIVGGALNLEGCTGITSLPEGLTVGGWLDLEGCTGITRLPEGLTVDGWLDLEGCTDIKAGEARKVRRLEDGDIVIGKYIYADGILTHIRGSHQVEGYTMYTGAIPGRHVVTDGTYYAHCETFREGVADIALKRAKERGAEQYKGMSLDTSLTVEEAVTMYRIITGACSAGAEAFVASIRDLKERYTIGECIELTRGRYGAETFAKFFGG